MKTVYPETTIPPSFVAERPSPGYGRQSVVQSCIEDEPPHPERLVEMLRAGLLFRELEALRKALDLPMDRLAVHLGMSRATLHRRKTAGRLDASESDRVVRFARLVGLAASVMESLEAGRAWLAAPQMGLGGEVPLAYAETEVGARVVEELLGRIEYGVYA